MTPVLLSNPGLPLAIYGNPGRPKRRGTAKHRAFMKSLRKRKKSKAYYAGRDSDPTDPRTMRWSAQIDALNDHFHSRFGAGKANPGRIRSRSRRVLRGRARAYAAIAARGRRARARGSKRPTFMTEREMRLLTRNPVFLGPKAGMWATNPVRKSIASRFPGWKVVSVKSVNPSRARARRSKRKNPMAKAVRSKSTGRFLKRRASHRTRRFQVRRARYTVGRTYKTKKGWVRVQRAHVRRKAGKRRSHPAVKWSGRKGKISYRGIGTRKGRKGISVVRFTNPRRKSRRSRRRNPAVSLKGFVGGLTSAPSGVMSTFKNFSIKKGAFLAGGTVGAYVLGGIASRFISPLLGKVPVIGPMMAQPMVQRVVGAAFPYTVAFVASKAMNLGKYKHAVLLGGAVASILELLVPGKVASIIQQIPGLNKLPGVNGLADLGGLSGPVAGLSGFFGTELAGYVQAPSYAGVGDDQLAGYVQAPSYAGVGNQDALAGYVQAPSYAGVGGLGYLNDSDAMVSYLDPSQQ